MLPGGVKVLGVVTNQEALDFTTGRNQVAQSNRNLGIRGSFVAADASANRNSCFESEAVEEDFGNHAAGAGLEIDGEDGSDSFQTPASSTEH